VDFIGLKVGDVNNTMVFTNPFACEGDTELPASILGNVFQDQNSDCLFNAGDSGMQGWAVSASDGVNTFWGTTNADGAYAIGLLPGTYDIVLYQPCYAVGRLPRYHL